MAKQTADGKRKLPWFRFHATDWLTSPTVLLMNRNQKSMLVDLLCYIHGSGNCRLRATEADARRLLNVSDDEQNDFKIVWNQLADCPDDDSAKTHLKMWEWYCADRDVHLKRQKAGRKGGKHSASKRQANAKQNASKSQAKGKQTLYVSVSDSVSKSNSKLLETKDGKRPRFQPPTLEDCVAFFVANGSNELEAEKYFCYYDSNGWKVGKNKMKQWRSAAGGWIKRNLEASTNGTTNGKPTYQQTKDERTKEVLRKAFD